MEHGLPDTPIISIGACKLFPQMQLEIEFRNFVYAAADITTSALDCYAIYKLLSCVIALKKWARNAEKCNPGAEARVALVAKRDNPNQGE